MKCKCGFQFAGPGEFRNCEAFIDGNGQGGVTCPKCNKHYVNGREIKRDDEKKHKKVGAKTTKILKKYWKAYQVLEDKYRKNVHKLELKMEKETNIKGIEFFRVDGAVVGIGDYGFWRLPLIQREDLE